MTKIFRKVYSPVAFDILFASMALIALFSVLASAGRDFQVFQGPVDPVRKGLTFVAIVIAAAFCACISAKLDQRLADENTFQTLGKSAIIGNIGFIFTFVAWHVLAASTLGSLPPAFVIAALICCWSIGYFYTRITGTRA